MNWPFYDEKQIARVSDILRSGRVNYWNGDEGRAFEKEFAEAMGCRHAVALSNGTVALELALHAIGLQPGDEVIVSPRSFYASAGCVVLQGGVPVFADIDRNSQNISAATIARVITQRTRAIICVHLAGWPCDMDPIMELAEKHGIMVIEDCAQSHGARYKDRPLGSIGHAAGFSFCTDKIMSTGGEGGMLTTNDEAIWRRAWEHKDHGRGYETHLRQNHPPGFRWFIESFGTNWRMTEMQSAIGREQLKLLPEWVTKRRRNAAILDEYLKDLSGIRLPKPAAHEYHAFYKYYFFVRPEHLKSDWSRDRLMQEIESQGVRCLAGVCPEIYNEVAFKDAGMGPRERLPVAKELGETSLMLEVHPSLDAHDMQQRGEIIRKLIADVTAVEIENTLI